MKNLTLKCRGISLITIVALFLPFFAMAQSDSFQGQEELHDTTNQKKQYKKAKLKYVYYAPGLSSNIDKGTINGRIGFKAVFRNNIGMSLEFQQFSHESEDLPDDYDDGFWGSLFGGKPTDDIGFCTVRMSKIWSFNSSSARLGLEAGPSWVSFSKTKFTPQNLCFLCFDNYAESKVTVQGIGLSLQSNITVPLGRYFGLEFGVFAELNQFRPVYGFHGACLFGKVRRRR